MTRNVLLACLVVSVVLNLIALGYVIGQKVDSVPFTRAITDVSGISHILRPLEDERRTEIIQELRPHLTRTREMYREVDAAQRLIYTAATSSEYDSENFRRSLRHYNDVRNKVRETNDNALTVAMSKLTPAERRSVFEKAMPARRIRDMRGERMDRRSSNQRPPRPQR